MSKVRASNLKPYEITAWFASHDPLQELDQMQQALILARFKVRPKLHPATQALQNTIITWRGSIDYLQLTSDNMRQIASIIKKHKEIAKYDLLKECERVLVCRGKIKGAVDHTLRVLRTRAVITIKRL